jgi:integrase
MASIVKLGKGKSPPRAIDFKNTTGKRDRLRLGIVSHDDAQEACRRVEKLLAAKRLNQSADGPTLEWVAGVSDEIHERLARFGLCRPRVEKNIVPTLQEWVAKFIEQRKPELKEGSIQRLQQTADKLLAYFGSEIRLDLLKPDGAADWRAAMQAELKPLRKGEKGGVEKRGPRYSETTIRNATRDAKTIFNAAVDREIITRNPFAKLKSSVLASNRDRYVTPEESKLILEECHSIAWKVLFGLGRFAGLRTPSETHRLSWDDVDLHKRRLTVYASKTDATRIVPITEDLHDILRDAYDAAPEGTVKVVSLGSHRSNLHRGLEKIITRAGLAPWDDLFQTLRCCAETDFARKYPQHEVSRWIGHSIRVSEKHYLMSDNSVMDEAANAPGLLRAAQSAAVGSRTSSQVEETHRNDGELVVATPNPKNEENPRKSGVFLSSKGGTRTRDPRLMKPVL